MCIRDRAQGLLLGPAGNQIRSSGDLVSFFGKVREWYGHKTDLLAPIARNDYRETEELGPYDIPVPKLPTQADYYLGLTHRTYFQAYNVYSPCLLYTSRFV